jgi:uncharacterized protein (TIGR03083 family)
MEPLTPIYTADLFPPLHAQLIALLRGLEDSDWARPTIAAPWKVRDVVAHLLDGDLRKLSGGRDRQALALRPLTSFSDIVALINDANASGVAYAARLSPRVMTDLLEVTGPWVSEFVTALPPHAPAHISVAWAGEMVSENWMDIGREYTERWHHQMQIRHAVGADGLLEPRWLYPLLDLSVRAFGRAYAGVHAAPGVAVVFEVEAPGENVWSVVRDGSGWVVTRGRADNAAALVRVDADTAWRLLYNALSFEDAGARVRIDGDRDLAEPMLRARSVMV